MSPETCPNCGADVPANKRACPECGSCAETGWSDAARADSLGIPDENFDYEEYVRREFGGERPARRRMAGWIGYATAVLLIVLFLAWVLRLG